MSYQFDTRLKPNCRNFDRYGRRKVIAKPYIVGCFSVDQNRQFIPDHSNCKYLKLPPSGQPVHFDLNEGYETVQHRPVLAEKEKLDHILKFVLLNLKQLTAANRGSGSSRQFLDFDIICFRGKLRMLMCSPYEFREGWSLLATKWKGNIYLCEYETEQERLKKQNETEVSKKICSYGYKFEQFLLSDSPTTDPVTDTPVIEAEEFCCMFSTKLENTSLLYGAEMDGIDSSEAVDLSTANWNELKFTELKVRIKPSSPRQTENFHRFKTRNWWCQSYLANVQKIVAGLRTESGIVDKLEIVNVESMPKQNERYWSATVCMDFLDNFLRMVKHITKDVDCPHTVYRFDKDHIADSSIQCTVLNGPNECTFIPAWYTHEVQKFGSK